MAREKRTMPWCEVRPDTGVYYAYWPQKDNPKPGKLSLRTKDADEAEDRFAAFLIQKGRIVGSADVDSADTLTVEMAFEDYLAEHVMLAGEDQEVVDPDRILYCWNNLKEFFSPMTITEIEEKNCREYTRRRKAGEIGRKSGNGTIRKELGHLIAAINWEINKKRLSKDSMPEIWRPKKSPPKERWLTKVEVAQLIEASEQSNYYDAWRCTLWINLAYWTAHRKTALYNLVWPQVDLENLTIDLNKNWNVTTRQLETPPETKKRRPVIPIVPDLEPILIDAKRNAKNIYVLGHPGEVSTSFENALARAGLIDVTPHTLRHTRAVHMAQDGVSLFAIAGFLGDTMETVERNYLHHCPHHLRDEVAKSAGLPTLHPALKTGS